MKVVKRSGSEARKVLLRMVADTRVIGPVAAMWDDELGLFGSRPENLIAGWSVKHYKKFGKAPGKHIANYFDRWAEKQKDESVSEFVGTFLQSLSDEYKKGPSLSSQIALDSAAHVFDRVRLERLRDQLGAATDKGDIEKGWEAISKARRTEVATTGWIEPFKGGAVIRNALLNVGKTLITWPQDAMNRFFDAILARDEFVVFMAPEKRGKSFWIQELAYQGLINRRNVAFFEVGDQSQRQLLRRFAARAASQPFKRDDVVRVPIEMAAADEEKVFPNVVHEERHFPRPMSPAQAELAMKLFGKQYGRERFRLVVRPNSSINILGVESILNDWKRDGWVPDILCIDYLDILAPIEGRYDTRDQINATWKACRALSQKFHCLLVGGTQADADSYDSDTMDMSNFSEDKRKNAHVTGTIGICQTQPEKDAGLYRLNWPNARDLEFSSSTHVYCASCLPFANPCVLACFP